MIYIKKGDIPNTFLTYSQQENAHFDDMPTEVKQILRESLWREQGASVLIVCNLSSPTDRA